jgi:hypothetical protein
MERAQELMKEITARSQEAGESQQLTADGSGLFLWDRL